MNARRDAVLSTPHAVPGTCTVGFLLNMYTVGDFFPVQLARTGLGDSDWCFLGPPRRIPWRDGFHRHP